MTCDDPRKVVIKQRWSNITRLEARIDLDEGRILSMAEKCWATGVSLSSENVRLSAQGKCPLVWC